MKRLSGYLVALGALVGCSSSKSDGLAAAGGAGNGGTQLAGPAGGGGASTGGTGMGGQLVSGGSGGAASGGGPAAAGRSGSGGSESSGAPAIRWLGRVDPTASGARLAWPGAGFMARFNGTGARVSLNTNTDYFEIVVDGQTSVLSTSSGTHLYDLAKNLSVGEHTVALWRRTEANNGTVEVGPITFDGMLLAPPALSSKRLEIVGDSISAGFGIECKTAGESFSFATENNYLTYQALTARKLGAEVFTEAWSGIGMWRDVGGSTDATKQMPARFAYTIPNDTATSWDFSRYTPGAVVVLLGTNDFAKGDPGQIFVDTYSAFVGGLRSHYAAARFYLVISPMLSGANRAAITTYLGQVVSARNAAGDKNVAILEFQPPAADAWACGHPNAATQAIMASVLEAALSNDLGW